MNQETLIKNCEGLIYKIASKFPNVDQEDLYQVGIIGLLKAYKNYHVDSSAKFSTYAYDYIFGEMYKLASENRLIRLSKDTLRLYKKIEETRYHLAQRLGAMPSNQELSLFLEIDISIIEKTVTDAKSILSLDTSTEKNENLYEVIPEKKGLSLTDKIALDDSFKVLSLEEQQIINCRYYQDYSQSETAKKLGMTQVMVSRYEKKSIEKMRSYLTV